MREIREIWKNIGEKLERSGKTFERNERDLEKHLREIREIWKNIREKF